LSAQAPFDVWKARKVSQNRETKLVLVFEKDTMNLKNGVIFIYLFFFLNHLLINCPEKIEIGFRCMGRIFKRKEKLFTVLFH